MNNYWVENDLMHVEFISFHTTPLTISGGNLPDLPEVKSFALKSYQKATLKKRN
jgi:hypothetical protein